MATHENVRSAFVAYAVWRKQGSVQSPDSQNKAFATLNEFWTKNADEQPWFAYFKLKEWHSWLNGPNDTSPKVRGNKSLWSIYIDGCMALRSRLMRERVTAVGFEVLQQESDEHELGLVTVAILVGDDDWFPMTMPVQAAQHNIRTQPDKFGGVVWGRDTMERYLDILEGKIQNVPYAFKPLQNGFDALSSMQ